MEDLGFIPIFVNEYATGYTHPDGMVACVLTKDYVPISRFKEIFEMLGDEVREGGYHKFIFDKSHLRTFHQPSMKWYFTEWKTEMVGHGLVKHYKVLPALPYFQKAVEAARKPLLSKYPKDILDKLTITYFNTVQEAVEAE